MNADQDLTNEVMAALTEVIERVEAGELSATDVEMAFIEGSRDALLLPETLSRNS